MNDLNKIAKACKEVQLSSGLSNKQMYFLLNTLSTHYYNHAQVDNTEIIDTADLRALLSVCLDLVSSSTDEED